MQTTKTDEFAIDPRDFQPFDKSTRHPEPPWLPGSYAEERTALVAHVIRDLRDNPPTERNRITGAVLVNPDPTWHRIRALPVRADGKTVDQLLSVRGDQPYTALRELITWLLGARARRVELVKQMAQLEAVERAFSATPRATGDRVNTVAPATA